MTKMAKVFRIGEKTPVSEDLAKIVVEWLTTLTTDNNRPQMIVADMDRELVYVVQKMGSERAFLTDPQGGIAVFLSKKIAKHEAKATGGRVQATTWRRIVESFEFGTVVTCIMPDGATGIVDRIVALPSLFDKSDEEGGV